MSVELALQAPRIIAGDINPEIDAVVLERVHVETSIILVSAFRAVLSYDRDNHSCKQLILINLIN